MQRKLLQQAARHLEALLRRLVGVGGRAQRDGLAPLHLLQIAPQQPRRLLLDVNLALEVQPVAHFHELVGIARIAVFAGEFAAAIRVNGPGEGYALRGAAAQDGARVQGEELNQVALAEGLALSRQFGNADQRLRALVFVGFQQ